MLQNSPELTRLFDYLKQNHQLKSMPYFDAIDAEIDIGIAERNTLIQEFHPSEH